MGGLRVCGSPTPARTARTPAAELAQGGFRQRLMSDKDSTAANPF